jgi:hypothetical protein
MTAPSLSPDADRFSDISDDELWHQLQLTGAQEDLLDSRIGQARQMLGSIATQEGFRAGRVFDIAGTASQRKVTDPYKPDPELPRAPETFMGRHSIGRAMGRFATRFSLNGPRGGTIRAEAASRPAGNPTSFLGQQTDKFAARRLRKQDLRQERAKHAEAVLVGGIGLGKTARLRSVKYRRELRGGLNRDYEAGTITAKELLTRSQGLKRERVVAPVKAMRRENRRERAGAMYSFVRADQPVRKRVRALKKRGAEAFIGNANIAIDRAYDRRHEIEDELRRRHMTTRTGTPVDPFDDDDAIDADWWPVGPKPKLDKGDD